MEKLIELLNEYEREGWLDLSRYSYTDNEYDLRWKLDKLSELKPFIEWLAQNEKIDMKKHFYDKMSCVWYSDLNIVLCELAISDTPIEDLISYLK